MGANVTRDVKKRKKKRKEGKVKGIEEQKWSGEVIGSQLRESKYCAKETEGWRKG